MSQTGGKTAIANAGHCRQPEREERRKRGQHIDSVGYDAGKKIKGKKRHAAVDTLGLMVGLIVTPADVQDRDAISTLLKKARGLHPSIAKAIADGGYQGEATANEVQADAGIPLEIVKRSDKVKGFKVLPKRWIVERTFGWLGRCRRLAKDWEKSLESATAFAHIASISMLTRRIARYCQHT